MFATAHRLEIVILPRSSFVHVLCCITGVAIDGVYWHGSTLVRSPMLLATVARFVFHHLSSFAFPYSCTYRHKKLDTALVWGAVGCRDIGTYTHTYTEDGFLFCESMNLK